MAPRHTIMAAAATFVVSAFLLMSLNETASGGDQLTRAAGHYVIQSSSRVEFSVEQIGGGGIHGRFHAFSGTFDINAGNFARSRVDFTLRPASVVATEPRITRFLKSSAVFDVADFPAISFRSYRVKRTGAETAEIQGMLTARGKALRQTFTAKLVDMNDRTIAFHVSGMVYRAPYGMDVGLPIYSNVVDFDMTLKARRA